MKRLSKVSKEFAVKITDIVEFLGLNGFDYSDDPAEEISDEAYNVLRYNLNAFLIQRRNKVSEQKSKNEKENNEHIPLELKIVLAASKEKKLIERIVGFCNYDWQYVVAKYKGVCSQPVPFGIFDDVLCNLLLQEKLPFSRIGEILGLDVKKDPAEYEILHKALNNLRQDNILQFDEADNAYLLTAVGQEYARNGFRFSTFTREFELYFDLTGNVIEPAKHVFSRVKSEKLSTKKPDLDWDIEGIKKLAEHQAPEIHFPQKSYHLQSAKFIEADIYEAKLWVVLFENFRDNSLRAIVFDEIQNTIIPELSLDLNDRQEAKNLLIDRLVALEDSPIELTSDEKSAEQIESEKLLIAKHEEIEVALSKKENEKVESLSKELEYVKRHFNTLEFEVELKRLFDTTSDELWIISPWIKKAAIHRIPFFESYLKKGGKIFIGYSEPETPGDIMVLPEAMDKLEDLERKYPNSFYIHALPFFHWKNVWLRKEGNQNIYYTGSYNILSFFVKQNSHRVRQEEMIRLDWNEDTQRKFEKVVTLFATKYLLNAKNELEAICKKTPPKLDRAFLQRIKAFDVLKLRPFVDHNLKDFNKSFQELEDLKRGYLGSFRKQFFAEQIEIFKRQSAEYAQKSILPEMKRKMKTDFEKLRDEFIEFMDLQLVASPIANTIDGLRETRFNPSLNTRQKTGK
jgi:hypothetical protein